MTLRAFIRGLGAAGSALRESGPHRRPESPLEKKIKYSVLTVVVLGFCGLAYFATLDSSPMPPLDPPAPLHKP
jgi:hypothetical protein